MRRARAALVALVLATGAARGYEPDPVSDRLVDIADATDVLNAEVNRRIRLVAAEWHGPRDDPHLVYVMWRFRASAHPNPTRTTHNTLLEVVWTAAPVMILVLIAIKSFPLLNFEEFSVGNYTIGRGYDPGAVTADRAIAIRPELRADVLQNPRTRIQLFGFYDNVWVWNLDRFSTDDGRSIASWGGGARAVLAPYVLVEATFAKPIDRPFENGPKPPARFLLSLTGLFSPMR